MVDMQHFRSVAFRAVVATLFSLTCAWITSWLWFYSGQLECKETLEKAGCVVQLEDSGPGCVRFLAAYIDRGFGKSIRYVWASAPAREALVARVRELSELTMLDLAHCEIDDVAIRRIAICSRLELLDLDSTAVTDLSLSILSDMPNLKSLNVAGTRVSDVGLRRVADFRVLETIGLDGTQATQEGIAALENCKRPVRLELCGATVTDETLKYACKMTQLDHIELFGTSCTPEGIKRYRVGREQNVPSFLQDLKGRD